MWVPGKHYDSCSCYYGNKINSCRLESETNNLVTKDLNTLLMYWFWTINAVPMFCCVGDPRLTWLPGHTESLYRSLQSHWMTVKEPYKVTEWLKNHTKCTKWLCKSHAKRTEWLWAIKSALNDWEESYKVHWMTEKSHTKCTEWPGRVIQSALNDWEESYKVHWMTRKSLQSALNDQEEPYKVH